MTQPYPTQTSPLADPAPAPQPPTTEPPAGKKRNTAGLIALILSVAGVIFSCIPGAMVIGWILLPISFILAIVSLFMKDVGHGQGITALIVSIVGTFVAAFVFIFVLADAVNDAFDPETVNVADPSGGVAAPVPGAEGTGSEEAGSSRANPLAIGSTIQQGDWTVTVNSVNPDANAAIAAANPFNAAAPAGETYLMVNISAQYTGANPAGATPWVGVDYVTPAGNSIHPTTVVEPEPFNTLETLYQGASTSGNITLSVPADTATEGTLAVSPTVFGSKVFFAAS
ncbi:hypothetical protein [Corynebacterium pacaense]|uniref:hypothetical protein n=1 Tax=Corynebacterium pacaense TaxID=1816684 RepID=UPI0015C44D8D|nr:hypothetical protein [Corynebacterium pacaense]